MSTSNLSKGRAEKGSKFWMQMIPNTELKGQFDKLIGDDLEWLSPVKDENDEYPEYELDQECVYTRLGIQNPKEKFGFWPKRQPQWDGIAVSNKTRTLYLVEAKARLGELDSSCMAGKDSRKIIEETMQKVHEKYYKKGEFDFWMKGYYQLGNRLTFLQKIKELKLEQYPNVKLVLVNFVNDYTTKYGAPIEQWKKHFSDVFKAMTGSENVPEDVIMVYYDVAGIWEKE